MKASNDSIGRMEGTVLPFYQIKPLYPKTCYQLGRNTMSRFLTINVLLTTQYVQWVTLFIIIIVK